MNNPQLSDYPSNSQYLRLVCRLFQSFHHNSLMLIIDHKIKTRLVTIKKIVRTLNNSSRIRNSSHKFCHMQYYFVSIQIQNRTK